jgi:glucose/arabinose dehydrogenase
MARPRSSRLWLALIAVLPLLAIPVAGEPAPAQAVPAGFREYIVFSGLTAPTAVEFAPDGRVFVAERRGVVKVFSSVDDPTPSVVVDLRTQVYNAWDRGLLDIALDPGFPTNPYLYVLYTYDALPGGTAPHWGTGTDVDPCPTPPGFTASGCVVTSRVSRLIVSGDVASGEKPLVTDWCQQFPSHSTGSIAFGPEGALYVSGGDGASFGGTDYGQSGDPKNPCGDPPGGSMTPPTAEGGALRSQDVRSTADPTGLNGSVIRVDPATGEALPDNPLASRADPNARRIIAYGLRNPFRLTTRPGTNEVWVGDVGWSTWEEINRVTNPTAGPVNFGWPCYEGAGRQAGYDGANLNLCESLYSAGGVTSPYLSWRHGQPSFTGDSCATGGGSSSTGVAFYPGGSYPTTFDNALFFADYSRDCIWVMRAGANGLPDTAQRSTFSASAANPVELKVGPDGDLWYVDLGGTVRRIGFSAGNQPPLATFSADPAAGNPPLTVSFDGRGSSDPDAGDTISYAWDLDGDGQFDDGTASTASRTYTSNGIVTVKLRVTDALGATDTASTEISVGAHSPVPEITLPTGTPSFAVGETVSFSGSAIDPEDGTLPASALSWSADLHHCTAPGACHVHPDLFSREGAAQGSFIMPDHEYVSQVELKLTATDSDGRKTTVSRLIDFDTVQVGFASSPPGIPLTVGATATTTPFNRSLHVGSAVSVSAPASVTWNGATYDFASWSDNGARAHDIVVPSSNSTLTAVYQPRTTVMFFDNFSDGNATGWQAAGGSWAVCRPNNGAHSPALCSRTTGTSTQLTGDPAWRDYSVEAAVYASTESGGAPLIGRVRDAGNFYALQLTKNSAGAKRWMLQQRVGATVTTLASGPYNYVARKYYTLKLSMKGNTLTAYISTDNGAVWTRLGSATSSAFDSGRIGARSYGTTAAFDNVRVTKL